MTIKALVTVEEIEPVGDLEDKLVLPPLEVRKQWAAEGFDLDNPEFAKYQNESIDLNLKIYLSKLNELLKSNYRDMAFIIPAHANETKKHLLIVGSYGHQLCHYITELYEKRDEFSEEPRFLCIDLYGKRIEREGESGIFSPQG